MKTIPSVFNVLLSASCAIALAACGGGGGGPTVPPPIVTGTYHLQDLPATAQAARQQLERLGTAGQVWVSDIASDEQPPRLAQLSLGSTLRPGATFRYALDAEPIAAAPWLAQLNERGRQGYAYKGGYIYDAAYSVYVKDMTPAYATTTYTYEMLPESELNTPAALLAQLNAQGARGFRWLGARITDGVAAVPWNVYVKDSSKPAGYGYTTRSLGAAYAPADGPALMSALQQGSATGARYIGTWHTNNEFVMVFERQAGHTTAVEYALDTLAGGESLTTMLNMINARATQGMFFWSDVFTADGRRHRLYVSRQVPPHPLYGLVYP